MCKVGTKVALELGILYSCGWVVDLAAGLGAHGDIGRRIRHLVEAA
jgi:hypothetical protein